MAIFFFFFFQAEDGIRDLYVTGVQTCALPISGEAAGEGQEGADRPCRLARHDRPAALPAHEGRGSGAVREQPRQAVEPARRAESDEAPVRNDRAGNPSPCSRVAAFVRDALAGRGRRSQIRAGITGSCVARDHASVYSYVSRTAEKSLSPSSPQSLTGNGKRGTANVAART